MDRRQAGKVAHTVRELLRQRLFGIACGYADANDAAGLQAHHDRLDPTDDPTRGGQQLTFF